MFSTHCDHVGFFSRDSAIVQHAQIDKYNISYKYVLGFDSSTLQSQQDLLTTQPSISSTMKTLSIDKCFQQNGMLQN